MTNLDPTSIRNQSSDYVKNVTDRIFCHIQYNIFDKDITVEYIGFLNKEDNKINQKIGEEIRVQLNLSEKTLGSNNNPQSSLIKSYTQHQIK